MPVYTYRRADGTTFDYRQKFLDDPLKVDPQTGQHVVRVIQPASVIFKGSGFYINDSKSASRSSVNGTAKSEKNDKNGKADKSDHKSSGTSADSSAPASASAESSSKPAAATSTTSTTTAAAD